MSKNSSSKMEGQKNSEKEPKKQEWTIVQDDEDGVLKIPTGSGQDKPNVPWKKYWLDRTLLVPPSHYTPPAPPADWNQDKVDISLSSLSLLASTSLPR